jgi:hypothetical protein
MRKGDRGARRSGMQVCVREILKGKRLRRHTLVAASGEGEEFITSSVQKQRLVFGFTILVTLNSY